MVLTCCGWLTVVLLCLADFLCDLFRFGCFGAIACCGVWWVCVSVCFDCWFADCCFTEVVVGLVGLVVYFGFKVGWVLLEG